jgi:hypothetical protein
MQHFPQFPTIFQENGEFAFFEFWTMVPLRPVYIFRDNPMASQEILEVVRNLLLNKKVCIFHFTGSNTHFFRYGYVKHKKLSLGNV